MELIDYYGKLCTKMYEYDKSIAVGKELDFYLSFVDANMKVLEPMCGNGRMLIPFMQRGMDIEGFDISEEMLKVCMEKGMKLNLKPAVFQAKIEKFKSDKKYDLIIIPFGSFSLLPDHLINDSLSNLKSVLKKDGKVLLTIMERGMTIKENENWVETNRKSFGNETIVEYRKVKLEEEAKILNIQLKYESIEGKFIKGTEIMDFPIRLYEAKEFETSLKLNGFNQISIHHIADGYGEGSSFNVFECSI